MAEPKAFTDEELKEFKWHKDTMLDDDGVRFLATIAALQKRVEELSGYIQDRQCQPVYEEGFYNGQKSAEKAISDLRAENERLREALRKIESIANEGHTKDGYYIYLTPIRKIAHTALGEKGEGG